MILKTRSLCPTCYDEIDAKIIVTDIALMIKTCPEHGTFEGIVETDPMWFNYCKRHYCNEIYSAYLIDVTSICNIKCKYCYHDNTKGHREISDILIEANENIKFSPFILTGGEPTTHPEFPEIVRQFKNLNNQFITLTNGIKLSNKDYFDELCQAGLEDSGFLRVGLSLHPESLGKDLEFLELVRKSGLRILTTLYTIDNINKIDDALKIAEEYKDIISETRIRSVANSGVENKVQNKVFVSDMIKYIASKGKIELLTKGLNNKIRYANFKFKDLHLILVAWYDITNVDLNDINCPPYYKAIDNKIYGLQTTNLINRKYYDNRSQTRTL